MKLFSRVSGAGPHHNLASSCLNTLLILSSSFVLIFCTCTYRVNAIKLYLQPTYQLTSFIESTTHPIRSMDSISLTLSDDDLFGYREDHLQRFRQATPVYSVSEAKQVSIASVPETPTSAIQTPPSKRAIQEGFHTISSVVHIPPGSSLLSIQNYSSADDSSISPSPPRPMEKRGRGCPRAALRHRGSPTPSPQRIATASQHHPVSAAYWGSLDNEIYCRIFAARATLPCSLCGAPSHPASSCSIPTHAKPCPPSARTTSFSHLSAAAPPAFIPPKPISASTTIQPTTSGIDKKGRPIMHQGG